MRSRGGVTGGLTIGEAIREFEAHGFTGQFVLRPGGHLACLACGKDTRPDAVVMHAMRRIEGVSDPADLDIVTALECPRCGALGTKVFPYGPRADPDEGHALRALEDRRDCEPILLEGWACRGIRERPPHGDPLAPGGEPPEEDAHAGEDSFSAR